jgi:hypothetical protein
LEKELKEKWLNKNFISATTEESRLMGELYKKYFIKEEVIEFIDIYFKNWTSLIWIEKSLVVVN